MYKIYVHMFMEVFKLREFASTPNQVKGCWMCNSKTFMLQGTTHMMKKPHPLNC